MPLQRSQLISALWTALAGPFFRVVVPVKEIPKPFARRVGNLLDKGVGVTRRIERAERASSKNTVSMTR